MDRVQFMFYPWFSLSFFVMLVTSPKLPLGQMLKLATWNEKWNASWGGYSHQGLVGLLTFVIGIHISFQLERCRCFTVKLSTVYNNTCLWIAVFETLWHSCIDLFSCWPNRNCWQTEIHEVNPANKELTDGTLVNSKEPSQILSRKPSPYPHQCQEELLFPRERAFTSTPSFWVRIWCWNQPDVLSIISWL